MKKNMALGILIILFAIPGMSHATFALDSLQYDWGTIRFSQDEAKLAQSSAEKVQQSLARIDTMLKMAVKQPFEVVIAPTKSIFLAYAGRLPNWSAGVTSFPAERIVLKSPSLGKSSIWDYDVTLQHEVAHIILGQHLNVNRLPRWLNEGLAMHVAGQHSMADMYTLANATVRDALISLSRIEQMLSFQQQQATLAYIESYDAVQYIQREFPAGTLPRVFDFMQENPELSYARAFEEIAGVSQFYFEWHWKRHLQNKYHWITVLSSDTIIWFIFPLLAILGYLAIRWRNHKKMQRWQREEDELDRQSDWDFEYLPDEDDKWRGDIH